MPLSIVATSIAVCSLSANISCGYDYPNPVLNGGFETGDLTGWTVVCPDGGCSVEPDPWFGDSRFRWTPMSSSPATLTQTLDLKHGLYGVEFYVQDSSIPFDPGRNTLDIRAGDRTLQINLFDGDLGRVEIFPAGGGPSDLSFSFAATSGAGTLAFDRVYVVQLDDGGAAHAAAASLAARQDSVRLFIDNIFSGGGSRPARLSSFALPVAVAGPTIARSATTLAWASGGFAQAEWDSFNTRARGWNFSAGIEHDVGDGWSTGVAAAWAEQDLSAQGGISAIGGNGHLASFALYALYAPVDTSFYGKATAGGGLSNRDQSRYSSMAYETYLVDGIEGSHWFASIEGGYRAQLNTASLLTPYLRLTGGQVSEDGYSEAPTSYWIGGVIVAPSTRDILSSQFGVRARFDDIAGPGIGAGVNAAWRHEFLDANGIDYTIDETGRNRFAMKLPGVSAGRDTAAFGGAIDAALWDQTTIFIRYDGELGDGFSAHSGQAGISAVW